MSIVEIIYTPKQKVVPNTVHLFLRYKWFDMIASGEKKEEYRSIKTWELRFTDNIEYVDLHRAYSSKMMVFEIESVTKGIGKPEWGAPDGETLIIKLGKKIIDQR